MNALPIALLLATAQLAASACPPRAVLSSYGCKPCPAGHYNLDPLGTVCQPCPAGQYMPAKGKFPAFPCAPCARDESAHVASSMCAKCPPGSAGVLNECITCEPGEFLDGRACEPCPVGSVSARFDPRSPSCTPCPAGRVSNAARTACFDPACPKHRAWNYQEKVCQLCPFHSVASEGVGVNCVRCPAGRTSRPDGAAPKEGGVVPGVKCYKCPDGMHPSLEKPRGACVSDVVVVEPPSKVGGKKEKGGGDE